VLVHQHHVFDIVTGLILGIFCYKFVYLRSMTRYEEATDEKSFSADTIN
jgi:hypothetical protein